MNVTEFQKKFDAAICQVVANIPAGRVMSYGDVARAANFPKHARMVSKAMSRSLISLPWHRVVRSNRSVAFETGSHQYNKQIKRLKKDGITLVNGKVVPLKSDDDSSLDEFLWG